MHYFINASLTIKLLHKNDALIYLVKYFVLLYFCNG